MGEFEPGDTKAWRIELDRTGSYWEVMPENVVLMCTDYDEKPMVLLEQITAMVPGQTVSTTAEDDRKWIITCQMVDKAWLDSLPEFDGW